jgi:putative transcriptional regulator
VSEARIVRARRLADGTVVEILEDGTERPLSDTTDYGRLAAMTEDEIEANALSDPDNPPLSDADLARLRRVPNPKRIRQRLRLTQAQFAARFEVPLGTLRDWERGARVPDSAARTLLRVIEHNPDAVIAALTASYPERPTE